MHNDKINVSYIMKLIRDIDLSSKENRDVQIKNIITELDRADDMNLRLKIDLIKEFLQDVVPTLDENCDIDFEYSKFEARRRIQEVSYFAEEIGLSVDFIKESVEEYEYSGIINRQEISNEVKEKLKPKFLERKKKVDQVQNFVYEYASKYSI